MLAQKREGEQLWILHSQTDAVVVVVVLPVLLASRVVRGCSPCRRRTSFTSIPKARSRDVCCRAAPCMQAFFAYFTSRSLSPSLSACESAYRRPSLAPPALCCRREGAEAKARPAFP